MSVDVVGIGNPIVDVIGHVDDSFIDAWELVRGSMTLIDEDRAEQLTSLMPSAHMTSGGSAANTMVGIASLGGSAAFIGKVKDDALGRAFSDDLRAAGVSYDVAPALSGPASARCIIQVTPDGERTMNTYLGACTMLAKDDVDEATISSAKVLYCEGYQWDREEAKDAIRIAMDMARAAGVTTSLTLSDPFAVERHRDEWLDLIADRVDLVFGNEDELASLFQTDDLDSAVGQLRAIAETSCITRSAQGSMIVTADEVVEVSAVPVAEVIDTTGAGDLYAAGVLAGLTSGASLADAGALGSCAAGEVIGHDGARPLVDLQQHCKNG